MRPPIPATAKARRELPTLILPRQAKVGQLYQARETDYDSDGDPEKIIVAEIVEIRHTNGLVIVTHFHP